MESKSIQDYVCEFYHKYNKLPNKKELARFILFETNAVLPTPTEVKRWKIG